MQCGGPHHVVLSASEAALVHRATSPEIKRLSAWNGRPFGVPQGDKPRARVSRSAPAACLPMRFLLRCLAYFKPDLPRIIWSLVLTFLATLVALLQPMVVTVLFDNVLRGHPPTGRVDR